MTRDQTAQLREEIVRLGPWHHDVQVTPELSTRVWLEASDQDVDPALGVPKFMDPGPPLAEALAVAYPAGLQGRSVLDCACNCGGYLFAARGLGAGNCFGFDVREHWVNQALWLREHCTTVMTEQMDFQVRDLYEIPKLGLNPFDLTIFNGIFYHLPDPITGLKIAADLTSEVLILETATFAHADGFLAVGNEGTTQLMSGVYGLRWRPTGPEVLRRILSWAGFAEIRLLWWRHEAARPTGVKRLAMVASKVPGLLKGSEPPPTA